MKTERRHELQTNELADRLGKALEVVKPYSTAITLSVAGLLVLIIGIVMYNNYAGKQAAAAWESYYLATSGGEANEEKLQATINKHPGSTAADWAKLAEADAGLRMGLDSAMRDHKKSREYLNQAVARYDKLADTASRELIRRQAMFNMGIAYEALGKLDKAAETFNRVKGPLAGVAQERAKKLEENKETQRFYDWFVTAELPSRTPPGGRGTPGQRPDFSVDDPLDSPFSLPSDIDDPVRNPGDVDLPSFGDEPGPALPAEGTPPEPLLDEPTEDRYGTPPNDADGTTPADEPATEPAPQDAPASDDPADAEPAADAEQP